MTRYLTNPLFLLVAVWTTAGGAYLLGVFSGLFPDLEPITAAAVLLSVLTFSLGYLTCVLLQRIMPPCASAPLLPSQPLEINRLARHLRFTLLMGLLAMLLGLYRVVVIASYFDSSFFELITHPDLLRFRLVMYIEASLSRISIIPILISLTGCFFAIGFVLLGVYLYIAKGIVKYLYLASFLFITLTIGLTNLSRAEVTINILYLVLAYGLMVASSGGKSRRDVVFDLLLPLASVVLVFVAVDQLLGKSSAYGHTDRLRGVLFSFYWYLASPLAAFNEFVSTFDGPYRLGQTMFYSFYKWLHRFALVPAADFSYFGEKTFLPFMANVYTYLRNMYEDFGMLGVAIVPYALGWITCAIRPKACRYFPFLNLYVILLVFILFSFYNYALMSNQVYMQIVFAFLFFRFELSPPRTP
jgi:oligosaccharide repeat unit polymerase